MKRKQRIKDLLLEQFKEFSIEIIDNSNLHSGHNNFNGMNETHMQVNLYSISKKKGDRLIIHRKINDILKKEFESGLHSLEIKIK